MKNEGLHQLMMQLLACKMRFEYLDIFFHQFSRNNRVIGFKKYQNHGTITLFTHKFTIAYLLGRYVLSNRKDRTLRDR